MKPYLFPLLLSLLLFVKLINCDGDEENEDVTISGLMQILFQKANKKQVDLMTHLSFVAQPFPEFDIENVNAVLNNDLKQFDFTAKDLAENVPKTMVFKGTNGCDLLRKHMDLILNQQAAHLQLNQEIKAELEFNTLDKNDKLFYDSYKQWIENAIDKQQMRSLDSKISFHILPVYVKFIGKFREELNDIKMGRRSIDANIESINTMYNSLYFDKTNEEIEHLSHAVIEMSPLYTKFVETLRKLKNFLKEFNNQRVAWVEYFIGMRKKLGGDRTPVEPFTKISKAQKIAKAIYDVGVDKCFGSCTGDNAKDFAIGCTKGCFKAVGGVCAKGCIALSKNALK
ncbi:uncharacterized protein LOC116349709 isoform X2 [Contarinia nasturtii]|uniref:uncharacterized protein LOC116349709 isoform X2 n=1 Tax=Contarinia nasturtii TaxID=265458 RepID=UPI0012D3B441|nr:uncharacterized protein LOC116349709 isoform X2 [Contarinia nasturtii]